MQNIIQIKKGNEHMAHATIITTTTNFPTISFGAAVNAVTNMRELSKQRRALAGLTADQLKDIGITPAQRTAECSRRFWQAGQVI
jgi:uncharacterized protein YjiS (DUF1127 family)